MILTPMCFKCMTQFLYVFAMSDWVYIELKTFVYITLLKTVLGDNLIWKFLSLFEIILGFLPRCCQNDIQKLGEKNLNNKISLMGANARK